MRFRQVHLDFHTAEQIEGIASRFDKAHFQNMLRLGHVNSITVFSKCHHGWAYHPSVANKPHPHLTTDLLKAQIEAAHEIDVKTPVYLSAGLDEKYAREHPEDLCRNADGAPFRPMDIASYHALCFNTPYVDVLAAQVREVCENYDADGIFLDIAKPRECYCHRCIQAMRERGLDPFDPKNAKDFGEETFRRYTERMRETVDSVRPGLPIYHNGGTTPPGNRDLEYRSSHTEIESLPTGGWGYDDLPFTARNIQSHDGREYLSMTGKFHLAWGEFGGYKHENALIYETALAVAHGAKCSIGDQLHPLGEMDEETYRLIGEAYRRIEAREPWVDGVSSVADVGLLSYRAWLFRRPNETADDPSAPDLGALRILLEGHYLFDVLDEQDDFAPYKVLVLPDGIGIDAPLREKLDAFVAKGGKLFASGRSGLNGKAFAYDLGAEYIEPAPFAPIYFTPGSGMGPCGKADYVLYAPAQKVRHTGTALGTMTLPYFERTREHFCSHRQAPHCTEPFGTGMSEGENGIYFACDVFSEYAQIGSQIAKQTVCFALDRLLGKEKTVSVDLPAQGGVTLMEQTAEHRRILHLLYAPRTVKGTRKTEIIEDCIPLYRIGVTLRSEKAVKAVTLVPDGAAIPFTQEGSTVRFTVPEMKIHAMVCIDHEA